MVKVAIVTDSNICLPQELVQRYGIHIVPLTFLFENRAYRNGVDITVEEFYKLLQSCKRLPTTSAPAPGAYLEAYREASQHTSSILCITITSKLSMAFDSAVKAKELAEKELPGIAIEVLDSLSAAGGQGFIALAAAQAAASGAGLAQVSQVARGMRPRVNVIFMLDTLYYMMKGGRLPQIAGRAVYWTTSIFDIKPILAIDVHGEVRSLDRVRTKRRAKERLLQEIRERTGGKPVHVNLHHASAPEEAEELKQELMSQFDCVELFLTELTPTLGTHAGPGALFLSFYAEK